MHISNVPLLFCRCLPILARQDFFAPAQKLLQLLGKLFHRVWPFASLLPVFVMPKRKQPNLTEEERNQVVSDLSDASEVVNGKRKLARSAVLAASRRQDGVLWRRNPA